MGLLSFKESPDGFSDQETFLKGDCFRSSQGRIDAHAVFAKDIWSPPRFPHSIKMDHGKEISRYLELQVEPVLFSITLEEKVE
jgi:hypothetical protein